MSRDPAALLRDLRDLCAETMGHAAGMDADEFLTNKAQQRILERTIELTGEAGIQLEKAAPALDLPWSEMRAMRNFLAHAYHRVDAATVWKTATADIPELADAIARIDLKGSR